MPPKWLSQVPANIEKIMQDSIQLALENPVSAHLRPDVQSKLAYLDTRIIFAKLSDDGASIELIASRPVTTEERHEIEETARYLVRSMCEDAFEPEMKILEERTGSQPYALDPMEELLRRREVVKEGDGFYAIGPLMTSVMDFFEHRILEIAETVQAVPHRFPALISSEYLEKVQYFKNFPHSLAFVSHLNESLADIERFADEAHCCAGQVIADQAVFARPTAMLSPTVCHHLYNTLAGTRIIPEGLVATAFGNCFRFEARNMASLERIWNFTMREIIFVGDDDFVEQGLTRVRSAFGNVLAELDLSYSVMTANDPFFIGTFRDQAAYQAAFELKYEVRALLPHAGKTIAVASYNRHGNFFGRTLDITDNAGEAACTGCFGAGYERLAFAFISQHGTTPQNWPHAVRDFTTNALAKDRGFTFKDS